MDAAWSILDRVANFIDVLVLNSTINLGEIESDKNMQAGGILRQSLRAGCFSFILFMLVGFIRISNNSHSGRFCLKNFTVKRW